MATEIGTLPPPTAEETREILRTRDAEIESRVLEAYASTLGRHASGMALLAVGGYGRRELFPSSDVDLLLLAGTEKDIPPKEAISEFLQLLWDSRMRPSHSVHTVEECAKEHEGNTELTISLLDRRFLAGDQAVFRAADAAFQGFLKKKSGSIAKQLAALANGRRNKFQQTIYHLEPNIKETPGGLRDLQTTRWLLALHPQEGYPDLTPAFDFLAGLRIRLHELAGRDQNALDFASQDALSQRPEDLMRSYYRHARLVDRAARQAIEAASEASGGIFTQFNEWRSRVSTSDYSVVRGRVLLRNPKPPEDLSVFEFVARHELRLSPSAIDRLKDFTPKAKWADWKRFLSLPQASLGLRAMQETGALARAIPEWAHIECLVVRDFYHRYTVDEHTLVAAGALESIQDGRLADVWTETDGKALVRFALLLHDIGKGTGRDHSTEAVRIAKDVLGRLGAPDAERETIEFLIEQHLLLSSAMTGRDLYDGETAKMLADRVGTVERLKLLTTLTYADISAVNPQAMTPWRLEQLWRVYLLAFSELTRELEADRIHEEASSERSRFLEGLPKRYLRTHSEAEIQVHTQLAHQLDTRSVAIEIAPGKGFYTLTLLTKDKPGLFASVAGAISSFGLNILKVEAFANAKGTIVDTFTFEDPHRALELNPTEVDRLRVVVRRVIEGTQEAAKLLKGRPKPLLPAKARFAPRVTVKNEVSRTSTLVEIVAEDRAGLLHDLAQAISDAGCNIEVVLIDTEAHKALDVFYVTSAGKKLDAAAEERLRTGLLAACSPKS